MGAACQTHGSGRRPESGSARRQRPIPALRQQLVDRARVGRQPRVFLLQRLDHGQDGVRDVEFQIAVRRVRRRQFDRIAVRARGQDLQQVGHARLVLLVVADLVAGVGPGAHDLPADHVRRVEQPDRPDRVVRVGLAHLGCRVGQVLDPGGQRGLVQLGDDERLAVLAVEPERDVAGQLDVLVLVPADGHALGAVQQDVGGHQARVGEQRGPGHRAPALLLVLDHPGQLADVRRALQQVRELGVRRDVGLDEHRPGRDTRGEHQRRALPGERREPPRIVFGGHRVQVGDEVEPVRVGEPAERAEVVAEGQAAGRGDAGQRGHVSAFR